MENYLFKITQNRLFVRRKCIINRREANDNFNSDEEVVPRRWLWKGGFLRFSHSTTVLFLRKTIWSEYLHIWKYELFSFNDPLPCIKKMMEEGREAYCIMEGKCSFGMYQ